MILLKYTGPGQQFFKGDTEKTNRNEEPLTTKELV